MGRAVIGKRATVNSEDLRGIFISGLDVSSGSGTDASPFASANVIATNASGQLEPTTFDSGAHVGAGYQVYSYHQDLITQNNEDENDVVITHNWGFDQYGVTNANTAVTPAFAFRWTPSAEIVNGLATKTYGPVDYYYQETETISQEQEEEGEEGLEQIIELSVSAVHLNANQININLTAYDHEEGYATNPSNQIGFALVVFYEDDFNGGKSL